MLIMRQHTNADADKDKWHDLSGFKRDATITNPGRAGYSVAASTLRPIGADAKVGFRVYVGTPMDVVKLTARLSNQGAGHLAC